MSLRVKVNDLCRLCATSGDPVIAPLKNVLSDELESINMAEIIYKYVGIMISPDDAIPKEVCESCWIKIKSFDEFAIQCENVQKFFTKLSLEDPDNIITQAEIKAEPLHCNLDDDVTSSNVKNENSALVKVELDMDDDMSNSMFDDAMDYPISELLPKKKKKLKVSKKKKSSPKKHKSKLKMEKDADVKKHNIKSEAIANNYFSFKCYKCNEQLCSWYKLKGHMVRAHKEQARVQCACGKVAKSKTAMYRHVQAHTDEKTFACDKCPRVTKSLAALEKHKNHHIPKEERIFSCASCPKTFNSKENLKSHERVHLPLVERYNYPCTICGNKFTTKSAVVGHTRAVHEKIKRFICDVCGYACSTGGELIQHRAIHSEEKLFQCSKCPKKFKTSSNLKAHLDTHDGTSYPCGMCDKVLNSRRTYRKHLLVHDDLCRHVCSFCNKAFKRRQTLKVHLTCHTGDTPVQCPWCPQKFAYSSACRTHKQRCHPEEFLLQQQQQSQTISQPRNAQNNTGSKTNNTQTGGNTGVTINYNNISIEPLDVSKEVLKLTLEIPTNNGSIVTEIPQCDAGS